MFCNISLLALHIRCDSLNNKFNKYTRTHTNACNIIIIIAVMKDRFYLLLWSWTKQFSNPLGLWTKSTKKRNSISCLFVQIVAEWWFHSIPFLISIFYWSFVFFECRCRARCRFLVYILQLTIPTNTHSFSQCHVSQLAIIHQLEYKLSLKLEKRKLRTTSCFKCVHFILLDRMIGRAVRRSFAK